MHKNIILTIEYLAYIYSFVILTQYELRVCVKKVFAV